MKLPLIRKGDYIYGSFVIPEKRNGFINDTNPGDRKDILGRFPFSLTSVNLSITYAKAVQKSWNALEPTKRRHCVAEFKRHLIERLGFIAALMMRETGTPLLEAKTELEETCSRIDHLLLHSEKQDAVHNSYEGLGVVGILTPAQMPFQSSALYTAAAILAGNAVVHKPSKYSPAIGQTIAELWDRSGLMRGIYNMVQGPGSIVGQKIMSDPNLDGAIAAGSFATGQKILQSVSASIPLRLHMGGKCTALINTACNIVDAASEIIASFCRASGQRPDAIARIIVVDEKRNELVDQIISQLRKINIGFGEGNTIDMGPLISESVQRRYLKFGKSLSSHGHKALLEVQESPTEHKTGFYVKPALYLIDWEHKDPILHLEPPGPLLLVYSVPSFQKGIELHNRFSARRMCGVFGMEATHLELNHIDSGAVFINRAPKEDEYSHAGRGISSNNAATGVEMLNDLQRRKTWIAAE